MHKLTLSTMDGSVQRTEVGRRRTRPRRRRPETRKTRKYSASRAPPHERLDEEDGGVTAELPRCSARRGMAGIDAYRLRTAAAES